MSERKVSENSIIQESSLSYEPTKDGSSYRNSLFSNIKHFKKETEDILKDGTINFTTNSLVGLLLDFNRPLKGINKNNKIL